MWASRACQSQYEKKALTVRHVIDQISPLFGLTAEHLKLTERRMLASIVCIDPVIQASVQTQTEYIHEHIAWNHRFVEIDAEDAIGRYTVDYSKFHETVEIEGRRDAKGEWWKARPG
ncbi:MAG: hypothetical protein WBZ19_18890 [Chthoniobacterales bacterium]